MQSGASPKTGTVRRVSAAFTLVELLVVIGIIALLISILLPALNKARQSASMTACKANLKSIGQAVFIYAAANRGSLPIGQMDRIVAMPDGTNATMVGGGTNWVLLLQNTLNPKYGTTWDDAINSGANDNKLRSLFLCPDGPTENDQNSQLSAVTHYAAHPYLMPMYKFTGSWLITTTNKTRLPYKVSQIRNAAEKLLLSDASLYFDATVPPGTWHHAYETPLLTLIDNFQVQDGNTKLFSNWRTTPENASPPINLEDSIRMKPSNANVTITANDVNADTLANANNVRFRHMRDSAANVLMADGHVEGFTINMRLAKVKPSDPKVTTLKKRAVFINYIQ
jgi:prepilin-type processing-associated H-X9-DG protein